MIFNVGARRSGTFWLQRTICSHPAIGGVPSETHLISHGIAPLMERFHHSASSSPSVGRVYADRDEVIDRLRELCDSVFGQFLEPGQSHVAERTPFHVLHLPLLLELYPDAHLIHIIRDGRDVARSIRAQWWGVDTIEDAAREWRDSVTAGREAALPGDRYMEVRYESLLREPERVIPDLFEWLGVDAGPAAVSAALAECRRQANVDKTTQRVAAGKWNESLSRADLDAIDAVAGDLLADLGYVGAPRAKAAPAPWRRVQGSVNAARGWLADGARRLLLRARGLTAPDLGRLASRRQGIVDELVTALNAADEPRLRSLVPPDAKVRVVDEGRAEAATGAAGADLLLRLAERWRARGERQVAGDAFPSNPSTSLLLTREAPDGSRAAYVIVVRVDPLGVSEVTAYRLPLRADSGESAG
jgi:hypothetical protein